MIPLANVLCAARSSNYQAIPGVEIYDKNRDALSCRSSRPIIAHPPCRFWSAWNHTAQAEVSTMIGELLLGVFCVRKILANGGVLEHPRLSRLFRATGIPTPKDQVPWRGFTLEIDQRWFGLPFSKKTWIWIYGVPRCQVPPIQLNFTLERFGTSAEVNPGPRSRTPINLARWLFEVALLCQPASRLVAELPPGRTPDSPWQDWHFTPQAQSAAA